jgi:hypothetical protein
MGYRTNTPHWGLKKAKLNVLGPALSKNAVNKNAPIRMKGPNEYLLLLWLWCRIQVADMHFGIFITDLLTV